MANMMERASLVKAMELVVRAITDENILYDCWFSQGVADGDIDANTSLDEIVKKGYCEDETFQDVLSAFGYTVRVATRNTSKNAFWCDSISS